MKAVGLVVLTLLLAAVVIVASRSGVMVPMWLQWTTTITLIIGVPLLLLYLVVRLVREAWRD